MATKTKNEPKSTAASADNYWGLLEMDDESVQRAMDRCPLVFEMLKKC